jgi:hypothetical protein
VSRSYSHETCRDCGGRTSNNGMGRDAHEHSKQHINGLKERAKDATTDAARLNIEHTVAKLLKELDERNARRAKARA